MSSVSTLIKIGEMSCVYFMYKERYLGWTWAYWLSETILWTSIFSHQFGTGQSEVSAISYYMEMRPHLLIIQFIVTSLVTLWLQGRFWRYAVLETLQILIGIAISSTIVTPEEAETLRFEKEKAERRAKHHKKWKKRREQNKSRLPVKERAEIEEQMEQLLQENKKTKEKLSTTIFEKWLPRVKMQVAKTGSR